MRLQTRLTITSSAIITAVSVAIGYGAITTSYQTDVRSVDSQLNNLATQIGAAKEQELSVALLLGGSVGEDLSVALYDINQQTTAIQDGVVDLTKSVNHVTMLGARKTPVQVEGPTKFRLRSVEMADGELVLLALPIEAATANRQANMVALAGYAVMANVLAALGLAFLVRRDLRGIAGLIDQAQAVAQNQAQDIETTDKANEVAMLGQALHLMVQRLQASRLSMQQFLGDASHELRTPLTTIRGYLDLLSKDSAIAQSALATKAMPIMSAEAERMQRLIDDLLLLAQLGEGARQDELNDPVQFDQLIVKHFGQLEDLEPERALALSVTPVELRGDLALLERLLANLVSNQKRHTAKTTETNVCLEVQSDFAVLTIDDSGPGLSAAAYARGPAHFNRFDKSRSQSTGGSGLGMSICNQIVATHGGTLLLEPSHLGGLRTIIKLPLLQQSGT